MIVKTKVGRPTMLRLHVSGDVNDSISINHIKLDSGKIDTIIKYDWYSKDFPVRYKANGTNKGTLLIEYDL